MLNTEELEVLKRNTYATILNATKFMIHHGMDLKGTKVRSTAPKIEKYGIWPTTEFLEFLLTNKELPTTQKIVDLIEGMVGFIIDKYNPKEKKWPLTDADGSIASAITAGHCIYVLKLYISRQFVEHKKTESIKQIIKEAEETLIADCRIDGSWKITENDYTLDTELNEGRLFYTHNAWFGIKRVNGYSDDLPTLPDVREKLAGYVIDTANKLLVKLNSESVKNNVSMISDSICSMARAIQILNDYEDANCIEKKKELCNAILEIVEHEGKIKEDVLKNLFELPSSVDILELPNTVYNKFSNNVPFDLYFAIKDEPNCTEVVRTIIKWYLAKVNRDSNCWFFLGTRMNTWPTCEALLVLSNAHASFFETTTKQNCNKELNQVKEKYKQCEKCKQQITEYLKPQKEQFNESMVSHIGKAKKTSYISIAITIFIAICAVAALITLSIITELYWLNTLITAAILPVILQIIFVVRMPAEYFDKMQATQDEILKTIDESEKMWKSE